MSTRYQCNYCGENLDAYEDVELGIKILFKNMEGMEGLGTFDLKIEFPSGEILEDGHVCDKCEKSLIADIVDRLEGGEFKLEGEQ